jgi:hypothetical protein
MAEDTLTVVREPTKPPTSLFDFATDIQVQAHRIVSLAEAIDEALDFSTNDETIRRMLGRALDYLHLLQEAAEKAQANGERVEMFALKDRITAS